MCYILLEITQDNVDSLIIRKVNLEILSVYNISIDIAWRQGKCKFR